MGVCPGSGEAANYSPVRGFVMIEHRQVQMLLDAEPNLGSGDESKCLPGWINSFCEWFEKGEPVTLSHSAISALGHTLIAARERARRLVKERDEIRRQLESGGCDG